LGNTPAHLVTMSGNMRLFEELTGTSHGFFDIGDWRHCLNKVHQPQGRASSHLLLTQAGDTLLHTAAEFGHHNFIIYFLSIGIELEAENQVHLILPALLVPLMAWSDRLSHRGSLRLFISLQEVGKLRLWPYLCLWYAPILCMSCSHLFSYPLLNSHSSMQTSMQRARSTPTLTPSPLPPRGSDTLNRKM
jgi:hypothetical protein